MKRFTLFIAALLTAMLAPVRTSQAQVTVSFDIFYDALDPHGDWVYAEDYGYCWTPEVTYSDPDWSPYADGYWAWTDCGWTWVSYEEYGWATYHYGRWVRLGPRWCWVPGYEWAPAWVSWRQTDDYIGWSPLPPEASWEADTGFHEWTDSYYDIGPASYNFVPVSSFCETRLRPHLLNRSRNLSILDRSVNITNIVFRQNVVNNIFVGGPDCDRIERFSGRKVRRLSVYRDDDFRPDFRDHRDGRDQRDHFRRFSRIDGDRLIVASPRINRGEHKAPPKRIRERFEHNSEDRGWRDVSDRGAADRFREKLRKEINDKAPRKLPAKIAKILPGDRRPDIKPREDNEPRGRGDSRKPDANPRQDDTRPTVPPQRGDGRKPDAKPRDEDSPRQRGDTRKPDANPRDEDKKPGVPPQRGDARKPDTNPREESKKPSVPPQRGETRKPDTNPREESKKPSVPPQRGETRKPDVKRDDNTPRQRGEVRKPDVTPRVIPAKPRQPETKRVEPPQRRSTPVEPRAREVRPAPKPDREATPRRATPPQQPRSNPQPRVNPTPERRPESAKPKKDDDSDKKKKGR